MEEVIAIVGGVLVCGGFWTFIQFLISRHDSKKNGIGKLIERVDAIEAGLEERKAATARIQILRFADELADGKDFAKGHYDDIYEAMNIYNKYCEDHPKFKNDQTVDSQKIIKRKYEEHSLNHDFKKY